MDEDDGPIGQFDRNVAAWAVDPGMAAYASARKVAVSVPIGEDR